jgi:hypothetical protein
LSFMMGGIVGRLGIWSAAWGFQARAGSTTGVGMQ